MPRINLYKYIWVGFFFFLFLWCDTEHHCMTEEVAQTAEDTTTSVLKKGHTTTICLYSLSYRRRKAKQGPQKALSPIEIKGKTRARRRQALAQHGNRSETERSPKASDRIKAPAVLESTSATGRESGKKSKGWPNYKRNGGGMSPRVPSLRK